MNILFDDLKSLPVETQSGTYVGKVCDLVIDADSHAVRQYEVKGGGIRGKTHLIASHAVVAITKEKMIVKDASITELAGSDTAKKFATHPTPALTSSHEL
jgi:sporulation protein YlmC with PRC-barrel domain